MRSLFGAVLTCALLWLIYTLFLEAHRAYDAAVVDAGTAVILFGKVVLATLLLGIVVITTFVPMVAEWVGNLFFNPDEKIDKPLHAAALAAYERGDYAQAVEEYKKVGQDHPADTMAIEELTRIYCEKLDDPDAAVAYLQAKLHDGQRVDEAFLDFLLAEIYATYLHDAERAREFVQRSLDTAPGGKHSARAKNLLREIESGPAAES